MRYQLSLLFVLICSSLLGQDTTEIYRTYDGYRSCIITNAQHTLEVGFYPNGKIFSRSKAYPDTNSYTIEQLYPNGKLKYVMTFTKGIPEGPTIIYDPKGARVMTIVFEQGMIKDTITHTTKYSVLFGNYRFTSTVYGGAQNEDGSSNISEMSGPGSFRTFKLKPMRPISTIKTPEIELTADRNGWFVALLPREENTYCIVPKAYENVESNDPNWCGESPITIFNSSGNDSWSISNPVRTNALTGLVFTEIRSHSVGYAP